MNNWWKNAQSNPIKALWSALVFIFGVNALLSLSELVVSLKGFALQLVLAYRLIWQEPLHSLASLINVEWPTWASDAIAIFALSNVAAYMVAQRVRYEVSLAKKQWNGIVESFDSGKLSGSELAKELTQTHSLGFLSSGPLDLINIKWPWYYIWFLPIVISRMYFQEKSSLLVAYKAVVKILNPEENPEKADILAYAKSQKKFVSVLVLRYYFLWLLAVVLASIILIIVSHAIIYLPAQ